MTRALELLDAGEVPGAIQALEREVAEGSDRALYLLADVLLRCDPPLRDPWRGIGLLEQALARGHAGAALMLAAIHYSDLAVPPDDRRAAAYLAQAAASGVAAAWRTIGILSHVAGDDAGAERALVLAAGGGDHFAVHALAHRAARGGEAARARGLFRRAALAGLPASRRGLAQLGAGPVEDARFGPPPGSGDDLLQRFVLPDAAGDIAGEEQQLAPGLSLRRGLLDPLLCDYLTTASQPWLTRSLVNEPTSGRISTEQIRTSWGMSFAHALPDLIVAYAERLIARYAGLPLVHAEPLAVLRYEIGQEYRPHYDYFTPETLAMHPRHKDFGQRTATVVSYIGLPEAGGGTEFPRLGITIEPVLGGAIRFRNVDAEGRPDERSLHAGLPVRRGEKWVATLWFRERAAREPMPCPTAATGTA